MINPRRIRLDSSRAGDRTWRFDAGACRAVLVCDAPGGMTRLFRGQTLAHQWVTPLEALAWMERSMRDEPAGSRWIGYIGYDLGRWFEVLPNRAPDDLGLPLFVFTLHAPADPIESTDAPATEAVPPATGPVRSTFTRTAYEQAIRRAAEYIAAGDIFQVNLSQRFTLPTGATPGETYARLRAAGGAWHNALLDYGDFAIVSNSPELFLRVTPDRRIITRPIKGTRPRRAGMEQELRDSAKDQAELNMIVDLERNDLGRVCEIGSVKVTEPRVIEAHPTVYHGVATVEGKLREEVGLVDLLRATFPGGSITGAPKIRAMQIIEELEPVKRGPYCGAIGYLGADGTLELSIAIRTMILKSGLVHIPVGGGIVADSQPAAEYEETLVKARATFAALGVEL